MIDRPRPLAGLFALFAFLLWMTPPAPVAAQEASPASPTPTVSVGIDDPAPNADLNGAIVIRATAPGPWDLSFAYADDPTQTWFPLAESNAPVSGELTTWDTTLLTDGFYTLRLRVFNADAQQEYTLNLRIRNYSLLETATPVATLTATSTPAPPPATALPTLTPTITLTPALSPTALPVNPAIFSMQAIAFQSAQGALLTTAAFIFLGAFLALSRKLRR